MSLQSVRALATIGLLTLGCTAILWGTERLTGPRIAEERAAALRSSIAELAGSARVAELTAPIEWPLRLCDQMTLLQTNARGYGGALTLAVALVPGPIATEIHSLQTVRHQETPGIGDFIAESGSDSWLQRFRGSTAYSLTTRPYALDAVSGATVTVNAIRGSLLALLTDLPDPQALFNSARCTAAGPST